MKGDIILNHGAHSFSAGKQLHARSAHSISSTKMQHDATRHKGKQKERQAGRQAIKGWKTKGDKTHRKADTPSNTKAESLR